MSVSESLDTISAVNLYNLNGLVGLVTGGGTGIGLTIAQAFIRNGAKVYITGRRLVTLNSAVQTLANSPYEGKMVPCDSSLQGNGIRLTRSSLQMDVTDKGSIRNAVKVVEEAEGALHILVNK